MEKEILEGNKLIAEFMGSCGLETKGVPNMGIVRNAAKYHFSLDWLMPVVDKIKIVSFKLWDSGKVHEKIWLKVDIWSNEVKFIDEETGQYPICTPITSESFIKSLWLAVVQFIQWYNTQSK